MTATEPTGRSAASRRQASGTRENADQSTPESSNEVTGSISRASQSARRYLSDTLKTLELESRKSALIVAFMAACATVAAVLVITAWMAVLGFIGIVLVREGIGLWLVALGFLLINLGLAWLAWRFMLKLADRISFSASQRRVLMNEEIEHARTD